MVSIIEIYSVKPDQASLRGLVLAPHSAPLTTAAIAKEAIAPGCIREYDARGAVIWDFEVPPGLGRIATPETEAPTIRASSWGVV
jgi:hypothetical protein